MKMKRVVVSVIASLAFVSGTAYASNYVFDRVAGPTGTARGVTSYDWSLTPAGKQVTLGDFPMGGILSPDGRYLIVSNDGQGQQSLQVVDVQSAKILQTLSYNSPDSLYLGVAFSPDGRQLYASAGGSNTIRVYDFSNGQLTAKDMISVKDSQNTNFYPAGLSVSPDGKTLYVANNLNNSVSKVDLNQKKVVKTTAVGNNPYTAFLSRDGHSLYVTNWGESSVSVLDPDTMEVRKTIQTGLHPNAVTENTKTGNIYVSNSDDDTVAILDGKTSQVRQTVSLKPYRNAPTGSMPDALAVSGDGSTLYVANAGNNDVAVVNVAGKNAKIKGLIPTAWYPTGVFVSGGTLMVTNAKGLGAGPNAQGQYIGNMMAGTLSVVGVPTSDELRHYTLQVKGNNTIKQSNAGNSQKVVIPRNTAEKSPIKHVIYVIKENRTYDQVLGDLGRGNGDPSLAGFGAQITPNIHKLAKQFVTLDNLYTDAEISAQGHSWSTAAIANDYTEKNWLANYSGRNRGYDFEGGNSAAYPKAGFLWNNAQRAGVSYRDYGEYANYDATKQQWVAADPSIGSNLDPNYPGWNLSISDLTRETEWEREFNDFVKNGHLPQLQIVRLPNDHTSGTSVGKLTPQAMVAQNDYAVGKLVDKVSHSKYWKDTAVFIIEDDAQNGWDHVDAHRTEGLVISPYTQTGKVDSVFYDTASMIRTMELVLGMKPMSQFDAASIPMNRSFTSNPDFTSYTAADPQYPLDQKNGATAPDAKVSAKLDFSAEDHANESTLNRVLWDATMKAKKGSYPKSAK